MNEGWTAPSTVVAAISAFAAMISGVIAWMTYRSLRTQDRPVVTAQWHAGPHPGWMTLRIQLTNRSQHGWKAQWCEVRRPKLSRCVSAHYVSEHSAKTVNYPLARIEATASKRCGMLLAVARSGTKATLPSLGRYGFGDEASEDVFISVPRSRRRERFSIRLMLASTEAVERRMVSTIKRTAPVQASEASA